MSDYLFDKEGEPDPEIERIERLLAPLAYRGAAPRLPARRARRTFVVAASLSVLAAALVALLIAKPWRPRPPQTPPASWAMTVRDGAVTSDGHALVGATRLSIGAWLETQSGHVTLAVADIGSVELAPGTRARIITSGPLRHELELERGTLAATIAAPPRRFIVTTPHAVVTDLGCAFELTVDEAGRGHLVVTGGKVAVAGGDGREVVVDAGARVELSERGPGAPHVEQSPPPQPHAPSIVPHAPSIVPHAPSIVPHGPHAPAAAPHAAKSPHHATHTKTPPAAAHAPTKAPPVATPQHAQPPHTPEPAKIEHDALKDLKNSVE